MFLVKNCKYHKHSVLVVKIADYLAQREEEVFLSGAERMSLHCCTQDWYEINPKYVNLRGKRFLISIFFSE